MGRKKKKSSSAGGQNPLGGPSGQPPENGQPPPTPPTPAQPPPGGASPISHSGAFALICAIGAMMGQQFGTTWWSQGGSMALAIFVFVLLAWRWEGSQHWSRGAKILASGVLVAAGLILFGPAVYASYLKAHAPPDDLLATFTVEDPHQLGSGDIDFKINFINRGSRAATIKDLGAFVAYRKADAFHMVPPCSVGNIRPESVDVWYAQPGLNKGSRLGTDDLTLYSASRSTLETSAGASIPPVSEKTVPAHVHGEDISHSQADETYLCPIIRYLDFEGTERLVVCNAYFFRQDGPQTRYPGQTNKPVRLLPHALTSECVSDESPIADSDTDSKRRQALP